MKGLFKAFTDHLEKIFQRPLKDESARGQALKDAPVHDPARPGHGASRAQGPLAGASSAQDALGRASMAQEQNLKKAFQNIQKAFKGLPKAYKHFCIVIS